MSKLTEILREFEDSVVDYKHGVANIPATKRTQADIIQWIDETIGEADKQDYMLFGQSAGVF